MLPEYVVPWLSGGARVTAALMLVLGLLSESLGEAHAQAGGAPTVTPPVTPGSLAPLITPPVPRVLPPEQPQVVLPALPPAEAPALPPPGPPVRVDQIR